MIVVVIELIVRNIHFALQSITRVIERIDSCIGGTGILLVLVCRAIAACSTGSSHARRIRAAPEQPLVDAGPLRLTLIGLLFLLLAQLLFIAEPKHELSLDRGGVHRVTAILYHAVQLVAASKHTFIASMVFFLDNIWVEG